MHQRLYRPQNRTRTSDTIRTNRHVISQSYRLFRSPNYRQHVTDLQRQKSFISPLTDIERQIPGRISKLRPVIHSAKAASVTNFSHSLALRSIYAELQAVRGRRVVRGTGA